MNPMEPLLSQALGCTVCSEKLPHAPRPVLSVAPKSRILVIGQAPGAKVHESGKPWDDASGRTLRKWLGVDDETFYDPNRFALLPMGFCYPGKGLSGDLPPRPECAPLWHARIRETMTEVRLSLLIGRYAQEYYLKDERGLTLTETTRAYRKYLPRYFPLPHPSPRNGFWLRRNAWFEKDALPELRQAVAAALSDEA